MKKFTVTTEKAEYQATFQTNHWILIVKHFATKIESTHVIKEDWADTAVMQYISLLDQFLTTST